MDEAAREALATLKLLKVKTHKSQVMREVGGWGLLNKATISTLLFSGLGMIMCPIIIILS